MDPVLGHFGHKSIAAARHRLDVCVLIRAFAECPPERGHIDREIALLDKAVRPYLLHQGLFIDSFSAVPYKNDQNVEDFWSDRDNLTIARQRSFRHVDPEWTKLVEV